MKTAGRENPKRWATMPRNREHGAAGQNRSCSIQWAAKQENFQPAQKCFFLTSSFIEQTGYIKLAWNWCFVPVAALREYQR
jgi:hypothetical protein